ncbi:MAG: 50S ribosomal protein L10 [Candidatus Micrarchaeaceae archaeon]
MLKSEKIEFVKRLRDEIKRYKVVGVMPLNSVPDSLLQKARNSLKNESTKIVVARKSLMLRALEGNGSLGGLAKYIDKNVALVLSNKDIFDLYGKVSANKIRLSAKPGQIAPNDIIVEAKETTIAPGQAVTDLKKAGIDVQVQKGKVVIAKSKKIVEKGAVVSAAVSKVLKILEIMPFEAKTTLSAAVSDNLLFTEDVFMIDKDYAIKGISEAFAQGYALSVEAEYITPYNVEAFIRKAYLNALCIGISAKIYEPGIVERLIADGVARAMTLSNSSNQNA